MTDYSQMKGWQGEPLPHGAQGMIVLRKFWSACTVMAANFQKVADEADHIINNNPPEAIAETLGQHPFFMLVMEGLAAEVEDEGQHLYQMNAQELYELVRGFNTSAVLSLCFALWVTDGAEIPEEYIEAAKKVEEEASNAQ